MKLAGLLAVSAILGASVFAATASASHVQCGDTITVDTMLDSDVVCGTTDPYGVIIGADNVTLHLGRHSIVAGPNGGTAGVYAPSSKEHPTYSNVHVRTGRIEGFTAGLELAISGGSVWGLTVVTPGWGVLLSGDGNEVYLNRLENTARNSLFPAVAVTGANAHVHRNTTAGEFGMGVSTNGNSPRIVVNTIQNCQTSSGTFGIRAGDYTTSAVVAKNVISPCATGAEGIIMAAADDAAGGGQVRRNEVSGFTAGIEAFDNTAFIWRNVANANRETGILLALRNPGTNGIVVQENTANDNGINGINAPLGTIDGGGNVASGNGGQDCINVSCTSG